MSRHFVSIGLRIPSALILILVATYYLLASVPFAFYHFLQFPHFWWMALFIRLHALLFAGAAAAFVATLRRDPRSSSWIRYSTLTAAVGAVCMTGVSWQPWLLTDEVAATLSFVPLLLLAAMSAIAVAGRTDLSGGDQRAFHSFTFPACATAALCSVLYLIAALCEGAGHVLRLWEIALAGLVSLAAHVTVFVLGAFVLELIERLSVRRRWTLRRELVVKGVWLAALLAVFVRFAILPALILAAARANAIAVSLSMAIVAFSIALLPDRETLESSASSAAGVVRGIAWPRLVIGTVATVVCMVVLPRMLTLADWGGTVQKFVALGAWASLAGVVTAVSEHQRRKRAWILASVTGVLLAMGGTLLVWSGVRGSLRTASLELPLAVDRYATFDPSLSVLLDVMRPVVADRDFYDDLKQVGDRTYDASIPAVPLRLVDAFNPLPTRPPNIFVIVVDSLRPDYLSPYNPVVTFTPSIGAFADDSVVFRQAFTPYAGTALSEPAIWAGGLVPRAQYVKPFSPINNLERLLHHGGYRQYVSVDEILGLILENGERADSLEMPHADAHGKETYRFELCETVAQLATRLDHDPRTAPVFFYSQPQNMHIRVLANDQPVQYAGIRIGQTEFFEPAVTTLRHVDACFGSFIEHLKTGGWYDNSIIVLTSDHGDAYGEGGRWGHGFYVAPEIVRVPLIMHVPPALGTGRSIDSTSLALLTDVTPTLFDLLGSPPTDPSPLAGRSLMPLAAASQTREARGSVLIQSSYSAVYGILAGTADWMYVADVNRGQEQWFDLTSTDPYPRPFTRAQRLEYRRWLFGWLKELNRHYRPG